MSPIRAYTVIGFAARGNTVTKALVPRRSAGTVLFFGSVLYTHRARVRLAPSLFLSDRPSLYRRRYYTRVPNYTHTHTHALLLCVTPPQSCPLRYSARTIYYYYYYYTIIHNIYM